MADSGNSRANTNRKIRQEALREQLANQKHVEHLVGLIEKIEDLDNELEPNEIQRLKTAAELREKLIKKYLPDLKQSELVGEGGGPVETRQRTTVFMPVHKNKNENLESDEL